jgi:leucyl aminopeptidase
MTKWILGLMILNSAIYAAVPKKAYITIGSDAAFTTQKMVGAKLLDQKNQVSLLEVNEQTLFEISHMMHDNFKRCGGYVYHESQEEALQTLNELKFSSITKSAQFFNYTISESDRVNDMLKEVQEINIRATIEHLSSYKNRHYKSKTGVESQEWLAKTWKEATKSRSDVKVELYQHNAWEQPSVIMTIEGSTFPNEIVVIGGHGDSIAGGWMGGGAHSHAPGADDNASGIATITEVVRVAVATGYKPSRTIKFMSYAAEEVGLRGSKEIADEFKAKNKKVVGVLQLDMTNFKGTSHLDIVMMSDFTNKAQNDFLGKLIDTYVHVPWGYSKCGYGCSDHASWHAKGYPASIPFESTMGDINKKIHTANDTLAQSGGVADHAEKFARLAVAYMVEMSK